MSVRGINMTEALTSLTTFPATYSAQRVHKAVQHIFGSFCFVHSSFPPIAGLPCDKPSTLCLQERFPHSVGSLACLSAAARPSSADAIHCATSYPAGEGAVPLYEIVAFRAPPPKKIVHDCCAPHPIFPLDFQLVPPLDLNVNVSTRYSQPSLGFMTPWMQDSVKSILSSDRAVAIKGDP